MLDMCFPVTIDGSREIVGRDFDKVNTFTGKLKTFDEALDEAAAWQIRNTYPTYSKVPEVIQNLRKLPFGNFVSFPAEMIRTTYNILSLGLKEATSSNANLRQMGYRRLIGSLVTLGGAEKAVSTLGMNLTGVTMEQIDAYKRSLSAPGIVTGKQLIFYNPSVLDLHLMM